MKFNKIFIYSGVVLILASCGEKASKGGITEGLEDNSVAYLDSDVNAIEQALPEIMVLPSDGVLKRFNKLIETPYGVMRDYQGYLLADNKNKALFSTIQGEFIEQDYPLNDLEQTLKQLATRGATDEVDDLAKDPKTMLLATAAPDIIVELDYKTSIDHKTYNSTLDYTLSFIDPYTNKVFATKSVSGADGSSLEVAFKASLVEVMPAITKDLKKYFSGVLTKGREVSVRITIEDGSNINLSDKNIEGDTYSDWIDDYMDNHTVKGAFKLKTNTKNEMAYTNVRIPTLNKDGTQYSSYQWGREFAKAMKKNLGVNVSNRSQGLADIHLVIIGI